MKKKNYITPLCITEEGEIFLQLGVGSIHATDDDQLSKDRHDTGSDEDLW